MSNLYDNRSKKVEHGGLFVVPAVAAGQEIETEKTVNAPYDALKIYGKSEQKAKWYQAEGITSQVQEDGYNLLNCNVEWEPSAENQGISNIQSGVGSISFDYLHDHSNYPYIRTKGTMHLKPGIYTISGIASGDPLDSVGFSQGEPDGYRQVVGDCNGTITIETEGDYHFYVYPMGEDRLASYELTNLMVTEGDTSKTYQEYGYSKPSPAYPSELTSHISAGSYQIPTENGIYEVTLTEDLRGLDDTYRDFIRFDSVSGTGYLENNTLLVRMTRSNLAPYRNTSDVTYRFSGTSAFAKYLPKTNANAAILCNRLKRYHLTSELLANDIVGVSNYTERGMAYNNVYIFLSKSDIGITADDTADTMQEKAYTYLDENPLYILVGGYPYREELTFTKVESSTLPVLPWTAYGINLFDGVFESGFYTSEGDAVATNYIRSANYIPIQPNTQYYVLKNYSDDTFLWYDADKNYISSVPDLSAPSPANAYYLRFFFYGSDKTTEYMFCSGSKPTAYEPFNSIPPESLIPSPDYPHQIYDLKDVTVTSRGRNLFDETTYPCVFNGNQTTNYKIDINAKTAGAYTLYCVISGMDGIIYSSTGGLISVEIGYSDSTIKWDSLATSSSAVNDVIIINTNADKKLSYVRIWKHDRFTGGTITLKNVSILEGTYTADTLPPFDKYRCTSATIPIALKSCGDDKDCLQNDGQAVNLYSYIKEVTIDGMVNNFVCNVVGSASSQACSFFVKYNGTNYERLKAGSTISNTHGFTAVPKSDSGNYLPYITIPWSVLGLTSAPTTAEANEAAKAYCAAQNTVGTPLIMRYVLYTPVITDCTDTWAQDLLGLKTAPYYTKLFADKETGGLKAQYLSMKWNDNETGIDYLLTSDGEKVVTNDKKTVILF